MLEKIVFKPELIDTHCFIDVRSPHEFDEDHIPGAYNVPLLTDEERVEVGTIHKEIGLIEARRKGLELTCSRFYWMVEKINSIADGRQIIIYCWRGGLRSSSVTVLLNMSGTAAQQLVGGYKAFRKIVIDYFELCSFSSPMIIMHGMTGTGKTVFINSLSSDKWSTIDLEGLANHRGSAFGALGLSQYFTQKHFETLLWDSFRKLKGDRPIVLEGESQRIGKYYLPGSLYQKMGVSYRVWCYATVETRIKRLVAEYAFPEYQNDMLSSLERIKKKLSGSRYNVLKNSILSWNVEAIARGLVEGYYDRIYYKNRTWKADLELELENFRDAENLLERFWNERA
ncbi:MAG: tRNA 2-selenouridine(34) synthase MnmH [Desulfuromonadaceae bacterium]|nr:tRNA 2-selenouridine(34) synthase MnmH [Desulfuromonadaceae bacterium]MDD2854144.1 tRNA 2-selenouridine(34) synthase MnmH [Desulfuromonadaceae bacterium]